MDNQYPYSSRLNRYEKKRKNTKWLTFFIVIGSILILAFISVIFLTGSDEDASKDPETETPDLNEENDQNEDDQEDQGEEGQADPVEDDGNLSDETNGQDQDNNSEPDQEVVGQNPDDFELEVVDSDEENVVYAYTSTWAPIPTVQDEPHIITWDQTTVDWNEMMRAAELATGVHIDEIYSLWVSGNGPQSVIATFSNPTGEEHFRVYISWIENQGWQPQQVDVLEEHDQLHRFGANGESDVTEDPEIEETETTEDSEDFEQGVE